MKNNIELILLVLLIFTMVSCDDFLSTDSKSTFTEQSAFSNLDFATKAVNGIYANLTHNDLYERELLYFACDNDVELVPTDNNGGNRDISHYDANSGNQVLKNVWDLLYQTIERANICIDHLPVSLIWEGDYAVEARQLYGEAVTLRALCYSLLISSWGDVPFVLKPTMGENDLYLPKTDRDSIYEYLVQDLENVEDYIPWKNASLSAERINKGFVKGLRARIALAYAGYSLRNKTFEIKRGRYWEEYYRIANQECREIIESGEHKLNPSFEGIFKNLSAYKQDMSYREILFEVAFGRLYSGLLANQVGMAFNYSPPDPVYGRAVPIIFTTPYYFYSFDGMDLRRNVSVELYDYNNVSLMGKQSLVGSHKFQLCKWRKSWINPPLGGEFASALLFGINHPIMRYADVLLMYAETENEINGGPTQSAKDALVMIRKRAFPAELWPSKVVNYIDSASMNKESFFNAIVDERAWEFGGEFYRKYDLIRWNLLGIKIQQMKNENLKILNDDPKYANVPNYIFWKYKNDNETLDILNPDYRLPNTSISGYSKTAWLSKSSAANKLKEALNFVAKGYDPTKNNYLYPINDNLIISSNGTLSNDQIP